MTEIVEETVAAHGRATSPRRYPPAGERLIGKGLLSPEGYARALSAETASWNEIMAMDEAALDAELGREEADAADAHARPGSLNEPGPRQPATPHLTLVGGADPAGDTPPFSTHYRLRLAGVRDGLVAGRLEVERELREIRRLLMASQDCHLTDVFRNLQDYLEDGRLMVVERVEHGVPTLEACLGYELVQLACAGDVGDWIVRQRVALVRLLAVREGADRARVAELLCLEAQLRATVRAMHDGGPHVHGMLGIVPGTNVRAIGWVEAFGEGVRTIASDARPAEKDRTLAALRDEVGDCMADGPGRRAPYTFVVANRARLLEAGRLHRAATTRWDQRGDRSGWRIDYDTDDPWSPQIGAAASALSARKLAALRHLGLVGGRKATLWGPPPTARMSIGIAPPDAQGRAGVAA